MPRHAFILGGTGQIGRAVASNLLAAGWAASISSHGLRSPPAKLTALGAK